MEDLHLEHVAVNGVTLHLAEAGPADGRLVILLHGFPEYWAAWLQYIEVLAAAGYHVIAPDQRGYNLSDKPAEVSAYDLDALAADVIGLVDHFGCYRFTVIGHDWGGSVGWWIATRHAERFEQLAVLNAPHPLIWREAIQSHPEQRRRSRYAQFFRLPWFPELLLRQGTLPVACPKHQRARPSQQRQAGGAGTVSRRLVGTWGFDGHAELVPGFPAQGFAGQHKLPDSLSRVVDLGRARLLLHTRPCRGELAALRNGRAEYVKNATHWVQHDEPERCRELLLEFLKGASATRTLISSGQR
jgi:pimeloyl-ACP methyl ester carboxylesterase